MLFNQSPVPVGIARQINSNRFNNWPATFLLLVFCLFPFFHMEAQSTYYSQPLSEKISLHEYAVFAKTGQNYTNFEEMRTNFSCIDFQPYELANPDIGFTSNHYWVNFKMANTSEKNFTYYLETARPITDVVHLYSINKSGVVQNLRSGDKVPFSGRSLSHRKVIFKLELPPGEQLDIFISYENDGEVLNIPLILHDTSTLLRLTYKEQLLFGVFFGILLIVAIIYLFFYFALGERSFLYYSLYVITVGLLQFSLDGYFYQYFTPEGESLPLPAVVLFAILSASFLGKYAEVYINVKQNSRLLPKVFKGIYISLALLFISVLLVPDALEFSYPAVNVLGLGVLVAILVSLAILFSKQVKVDKLFFTGIFFLVLGFVIFILNNLSILPTTFVTQNSAKFGTGLEIIFLSLSMANRIKKLKSDNERMQHFALLRAQEMNALKSHFLSNLSHELRTPLNAISGLADSMMAEAEDKSVRKLSSVIKGSSVRLLNLINDILDFSKIEKGEINLEIEPFDPNEVLEQLKVSYNKQAEEKGLTFESIEKKQTSRLALGDANRLTQIFNNLLENAVKFTSDGGIKLYLETSEGKNNIMNLLFTVSDSGVGIPQEKMDIIFESLTQENIDNKRKYGGLGLGLYITKVLVDMHKGDIELVSTHGQGTTCRLNISYPLAPKAVEFNHFPSDRFDLLGSHILVVEDNPINQMVLKMILKKWEGTSTCFAVNGAEGLELLRKEKFDIILMDLQMPVLDGYEACIAIRNGEAGPENVDIPIIAVTADTTEKTKQRVKVIGMDDYLDKPVDKNRLYQKITALLGSNLQQEQLVEVP